jgi:hypothetical protein
MDDIWMRMTHNLADRVTGPMKFRLVLQPLVASVYAIIGGLRCKASKLFLTLISDPRNGST